MNITRSIVNSSNWMVGREGNAVTGVVLHTEVGTNVSAQARFNDPTSQVSVHYGVELDGSIKQWVDEQNTAYQAGNWNVNLRTIGIEHSDNGNYNDAVRTAAEYNSSSDLVADICRRYHIPCDAAHIRRHHDVIDTSRYPGGTACPDGLDTNKIIAMAQAKLGDDMVPTVDLLNALFVAFLGRAANTTEQAQFVNKISYNTLIPILNDNNAERDKFVASINQGRAAIAQLAGIQQPQVLKSGTYKVN